ncbi:MAG: phenylalanine--tRNA ligase subunit alpha [Dehalococcoidia bacterium]|nr:phenylalanine--tRNA ligase subunit alpha [Dehalococcoidia bacterium]
MLRQLDEIRLDALNELAQVDEVEEVEAWRVRYLGKKGNVTRILRSLASLPLDQRKLVGAQANTLKEELQSSLVDRRKFLEETHLRLTADRRRLDITLPGRPVPVGRFHPITRSLEEICGVFKNMGFQVLEGPQVEWDYYNFEALNIPRDHPARDMFATLWIDSETSGKARLLRTHTSPMQIRIMEKGCLPIRAIVPGRAYRYEATDATHESMFYQVEGLAVDKDITLADLKGTLFEFCHCLFGKERKIRFRCDYFPFVEPGVEVAVECLSCGGEGCRLCGHSGWLEILGAGMVHPDVLQRCGIDPEEYTGFAFGMGVERIPMLRYGIDDIRLFYANDLRFLKQF